MKLKAVLASSAIALLIATTSAPGQAVREYNRIVTAMTEDYHSAGRLKGRAERKQAYIDHGKRFAKVLTEFLQKYPDNKMSLPARVNLAQVLQMAKEPERAKEAINEAIPLARDYHDIKKVAESATLVFGSKKKGWEIISNGLASVQAEPLRAELHFELVKYIERPASISKRMRAEWEAYRKKKIVEVCEAVAKGYPSTPKGKLAQVMLIGANATAGKPAANLDSLEDVDEKPLDLNEYKGKVVLLHFFTVTTRGYRKSKNYLTKLVQVSRKLKDKGLVVIGVCANYSEYQSLYEKMIGDARIGWRIYYDGEKLWNKACMIYFVKKFPKNIIIGRDGNVISTDVAVIDLEDVLPEIVAGS